MTRSFQTFPPFAPGRAGRLLAAGLLAAALLPASAPAQVGCGTTVGPRGSVTLAGPVGPCDGVDAAIVVDSATLDLGGQTVTCADQDGDGEVPAGIVLVGRKARVRNGTVRGCFVGVWLAGAGRHDVRGVTAAGSGKHGVYVESDAARSRLAGNTAADNGDDGFHVRGDRTVLGGNVAERNHEDGIDLADVERARLVGNTARDNGDNGCEVDGARNLARGNTITGNGEVGLVVRGGRNRIIGNTATANAGADAATTEACSANVYRRNSFTTDAADCQR
jgi:parallel beta-helix repeat protein